MSAAMPPKRPQSSRPQELGFQPQCAVRWLDPPQLLDTAWRAGISTIFGSYSDKREVEAKLSRAAIDDRTAHDEVWIDYTADLGDGFYPTYTVAHTLAQPTLGLSCGDGPLHETRRGRILVLGGDQVYPVAKVFEYENRFVGPFAAALPWTYEQHPTMLAIPGNHDWYDGLTSFLRLFCQERWIGGWRTEQARSYFAVRLPHRWWLFGIDIQLNNSIDQPQLMFFRDTVARKISAGDSIILCSAIPGWVHADGGAKQATYRNLQYFERTVIEPTGACVMLYLSGDNHHYARYEEVISDEPAATGHQNGAKPNSNGHPGTGEPHRAVDSGQQRANGHPRVSSRAGGSAQPDGNGQTGTSEQPKRQRITSGNGGAFLYPTHHLEPSLHLNELGTSAQYALRAEYPPKGVSRRYAWTRIWALPFLNRGFVVMVGGLYLVVAWLMATGFAQNEREGLADVLRDFHSMDWAMGLARSPTAVVLLIVLAGGLIGFAQVPHGPRRWALGLGHTAAHVVAAGMVTLLASDVVRRVHITDRPGVAIFLVASLVAGALAGSFVMALYLWACNLGGVHSNEAYSSMRIADYKGFLRMHIRPDGKLTIYPVGIDRVARRTRVVSDGPGDAPWFELRGSSQPHLIEEPVTICPATTTTPKSDVHCVKLPDATPVQVTQPAEGALR